MICSDGVTLQGASERKDCERAAAVPSVLRTFSEEKNDAAAVMRSRCALEKLCARSEKRLGKRELPDTEGRMKIVTDLNIV